MTTRTETLSSLLVEHIADAKAGHCLRVDDLTLGEAAELQEAVTVQLGHRSGETPVEVLVLMRQ